MKKVVYFFLITFLSFMTSCNHDDGGTETPNGESTIQALANLNPDEPVIIDVSNDAGESVVLMGTKTPTGHADKLQQMIITIPEEENPTEVFLDENQRLQEMIAPNGVRFQFDWVSEEEVAITLIDPNTNEQLNTIVDFSKQEEQAQVINSRSVNTVQRAGASTLTIKPITKDASFPVLKSNTRASGGIAGNVYLEQCGAPTTAQCWVDVYDYSNLTGSFGRGKYRGRFACTKVGDGHYQFELPNDYNVHHNIADYCDAINNVVGKVCGLNAWTAPGTGAKQFLCLQISAALASGIVSVPVAAGFLVACETTSTALDVGCALINGNMDLPEGTPNLVDGLCGALREMDYTWDTPLVLQPVVNALPSNIYGMSQIYEADGVIKDMKVTWGGSPVINSFKLEPSAPAQGVSYQAIADLYCLPTGTRVTMDIVGTDGYTDSKTTTVNDGANINYRAILSVPGAASGVKDVCTVTAVTPDGETVTKKASLIFQ